MSDIGLKLKKLPTCLNPLPRIPFCTYRKYRHEYFNAPDLIDSCGEVYNIKPQPFYWNFSPEEVADLLSLDTNFSDFKGAFVKNEIDGKAIILLEGDRFPRIGIRNFDKIKELSSKIRKICRLDQDDIKRSISLPLRKPETLYLWYKANRTGPTAFNMTLPKYLKLIHVIPGKMACDSSFYALLNHWNRIPAFMPSCPHVMIGKDRRINPMTGTAQRQNFHPKGGPYVIDKHALCMYKLPCNYQFPVGKITNSDVLKKHQSAPLKCY